MNRRENGPGFKQIPESRLVVWVISKTNVSYLHVYSLRMYTII